MGNCFLGQSNCQAYRIANMNYGIERRRRNKDKNKKSTPSQICNTGSSRERLIQEDNIQTIPPHSQFQIENLDKKEQAPPIRGGLQIKIYTNSQPRNNDRTKFQAPKPTKYQNIKRCNPGIMNIGNSCYLNSALQCFYQTQYLTQQINSIFINVKKPFTIQYRLMCKKLYDRERCYDPSYIKRVIQKNNSLFEGTKQHDSGEVINTILNIIEDQTNLVKQVKIEKISYDYLEPDHQLYDKYLKKYKALSFSLIDSVFSGFFKTIYRCNKCKKQKRLFEKFSILYLPLLNQESKSLSKLQNCFQEFSQRQSLNWDCAICKKQTRHFKSMQIYKANKTVIICLKRFKEDNTKIRAIVDIPLQLDLNVYYQHQVTPRKHMLYAAIVHTGEYYSGHYYSYCYDYRGKFWTLCDDRRVVPIDEQQLAKQLKKAYILFYRLQRDQDLDDLLSVP